MKLEDGLFAGTYVDCTFGRGGHSREILSRLAPDARLYAFDVDPEAVAVGKALQAEDPRFQILHRPFGDIGEVFAPGQLHGVLMDLGVSSPQLDDWHRGFNVGEDGPLDMRMNQHQGVSAEVWLQSATAEELAWVIHSYGEDDDALLSERIAETILARQRDAGGRIHSCRRLAEIVRQAKAGYCDSGMHPAKLTFQAIRVFMNHEMEQLDAALDGALRALAVGGRCAVISFKKKESNAVRRFVREHEEPDPYLRRILGDSPRLCELYPLLCTQKAFAVTQLGDPVRPSQQEVERNWRSRSSAVHVLMKLPRRNSPTLAHLAPQLRGQDRRFVQPKVRPAFTGAAANSEADGAGAATGVTAAAPGAATPDAAKPPVVGGGRRVYVANLSYRTTEEAIQDHFGAAGEVLRVSLNGNDQRGPQGNAVVEFALPEQALKAIADLSDSILDGRRIFVREDRQERVTFKPSPSFGAHSLGPRTSSPKLDAAPSPGTPSVAPLPQVADDRDAHRGDAATEAPQTPQPAPAVASEEGAAEAEAEAPEPTEAPTPAPDGEAEVQPPSADAQEPAGPTPVGGQPGDSPAEAATSAPDAEATPEAQGVVTDDYDPDRATQQGYLTLKKGDSLSVLYHGSSDEEKGWSYGKVLAGAGAGAEGWFPTRLLAISVEERPAEETPALAG